MILLWSCSVLSLEFGMWKGGECCAQIVMAVLTIALLYKRLTPSNENKIQLYIAG